MSAWLRRLGRRNLVYLLLAAALLLQGLLASPRPGMEAEEDLRIALPLGLFALGSLVFFGANAALALARAAQGRETLQAMVGCALSAVLLLGVFAII